MSALGAMCITLRMSSMRYKNPFIARQNLKKNAFLARYKRKLFSLFFE